MIIDGHLHIAEEATRIVTRVDELGIDRTVLVGVGVRDLGVVTMRDTIVFQLSLSEQDREAILGGNLQEIMQIC